MPPRDQSKEYGRRLYVSDREYPDHMKRPTDKALDVLFQLPHSENKKPYAEDSYEEMEYLLSPPFATWDWDWPWWDFPWLPKGGVPEPWEPPWILVFGCVLELGTCWCPDETKCFSLWCSHDVIGAEVVTRGDPGDAGRYAVSVTDSEICIAAIDTDDLGFRVRVFMSTDVGNSKVFGEWESSLITECDEDDCVQCINGGPVMAWGGSNPTLVNENTNVNFTFSGGTPPFDWFVTGSGATWAQPTTNDRSNTLNVASGACGCLKMDVEDACGRRMSIDDPAVSSVRVVENSAYSGYFGGETTDFLPCPAQAWADSATNQACDSACYQHDWSKNGPFYSGSCPQSCSCTDPVITHSETDAGCRFTCTHQAGARAVRQCNIQIREWRCT